MTDIKLLHDELKKNPSDIALMSAFADCLQEANDERAGLVRDLLAVTQELDGVPAFERHGELLRRRGRLMWRLRLRDIKAFDSVTSDSEGRVLPLWAADGESLPLASAAHGSEEEMLWVVFDRQMQEWGSQAKMELSERCKAFE